MDKHFSIVITGEWPGAGQSTTASLIAQNLNFTRVYAGFLFRKFAHNWNIEKKNLTWPEFEKQVADNKLNLDANPFQESDFNELILHQFQGQLKKVGTPEIWDKIIDTQSLEALKNPGVVVEAKVGVLLDQTGLVPNFHPKHSIYKFLLTCPPEISSHRVIKRKILNGELPQMDQDNETYLDLVRQTTTETIDRHLRDWERYEKIYGIYRSDIYKDDIIKIDTSDINQQQVVDSILEIIQKKQNQK